MEPQRLTEASYLLSPLLSNYGFPHAFFTRLGGLSLPPFDSLHFGQNAHGEASISKENPGQLAFLKNRQLASSFLEIAQEQLLYPTQVHGKQWIEATSKDRWPEFATHEADAVLAETAQGLACAVRTADCVPLLLADRASGRIAAIHAGWRGVEAKILSQVIQEFERRGSKAADLLCAIGPHIGAQHFEVSEDLALQLAALAPEKAVIFRPMNQEKPRISLLALLEDEFSPWLRQGAKLDAQSPCTFEEAERFFSYRRDGNSSGRLLSAICSFKDKPL